MDRPHQPCPLAAGPPARRPHGAPLRAPRPADPSRTPACACSTAVSAPSGSASDTPPRDRQRLGRVRQLPCGRRPTRSDPISPQWPTARRRLPGSRLTLQIPFPVVARSTVPPCGRSPWSSPPATGSSCCSAPSGRSAGSGTWRWTWSSSTRAPTTARLRSSRHRPVPSCRSCATTGPPGWHVRNAGIERARSPWVAFVDDDDLWAPGKLAAQLDALAADGEARWACVGCVVVGTDLELRRASRPPREREPADHLLSYNHVPGGGSGVLADRALVEEVGGFSTDLSTLADWDLWIRLALESPLATVDRPLLAYLEHGAGMSRSARRHPGRARGRPRPLRGRAGTAGPHVRRPVVAGVAGRARRTQRPARSALRYHLQRARLGDRGALRDIARTARGTRRVGRRRSACGARDSCGLADRSRGVAGPAPRPLSVGGQVTIDARRRPTAS